MQRAGLRFCLMLSVVVGWPTCGLGQSDAPTKPQITLTISGPATASLGKAIMIHVTLRNNGKAIRLPEQRHAGDEGEYNYQVFVQTEDGTPLPDSDYGMKIRTHALVRGYQSVLVASLGPGQEIAENLNLTSLVNVRFYGTYVVWVERDDPVLGPLHLRSNSLRIRIEP